jgi:hypothetical protein
VLTSLALSLALTLPAQAQSPHEDWRTLDTGHFRVHYPAQAEAWVLQAAGRFEAIHTEVTQAVGHQPSRKVDVVVMDPWAMANGFAMPLLGSPRMGVFPSPPGAGTTLAHYHDWADDLVTHEDVHLVHMDRPSRNPVGALLTRHWLGVGPVAIKSPMWAIEGYATMLEGQLTGAGRPHGAGRAAYLRSLALEGRLPDYDNLSGSDGWRGRAAPYLVGSAFFEWLVQQHGEQSARDLWARLSARKIRWFSEAFEGVYGAAPEDLYARFCAELTHRALALEEQRPAQQGTLWQDFFRSTGAPAVSPDGSRIAIVEDDEQRGPRLLVLSTQDNQEAIDEWQQQVDRQLERDPQDVAPIRPEVFPHEEIERYHRAGRAPVGPRWLPDGQSLIFTSWVVQPEGNLLPEIFRWDTEQRRAQRVTRGGGVQDADPHGGGDWAVAVQQRWGQARLVRVDLHSGEITGLTPQELDVVHDQPRIAPGGQTLAWLRHRGQWEVVLRELNSGAERTLPLPEGAEPQHLSWNHDGSALILSLALDGFVELHRLALDDAPPTRLTQTGTAALAPAPEPFGQGVYFLVPDSRGYELHRLPADAPSPVTHLDTPSAARAPVVPLTPPSEPVRFEQAPFAQPPRDYGPGRAELRPLIGAAGWRGADSVDLGLRAGDVVGRWEALARFSWGSGSAPTSASLAGAWRGLPVEIRAQLFASMEEDERTGALVYDTLRPGLDLGAGLLRYGDDRWGRAQAGLWSDAGLNDTSDTWRAAGYAGAAGGQRLRTGAAWLDLAGRLDGQQGQTGPIPWQHGQAEAQLGLGYGGVGLFASAQRTTTMGGGALERLSLGGDYAPLLPRALQAHTLPLPALESDTAHGTDHDAWRAALELERSLALFVQRHRIWERTTPSKRAGATVLGLELSTGAASSPMAKIPQMDLNLGLGCVLEHPEEGWRSQPLRDKDHWSGWIRLQWGL